MQRDNSLKEQRTVEFSLVARRAAPHARRRGLPWAAVAVVVLVAGAVAANDLTVNRKTEAASLFAERVQVDEKFVLEDTVVEPAHKALAALGTEGAGVELAGALSTARTGIVQDEWTYAVTVKEASAASVGSGNFTIALHLDEALVGTVHVAQGSADASVVEGVRARFAIGPSLATSALYYVTVKPFVLEGDVVDVALDAVTSDGPKWRGSGDVLNPELAVAAGDVLRITATNVDGGYHNLGIKNAAGSFVAPAGATGGDALPHLTSAGAEAVLSWTAESGTFTYVCTYHESQGMKGEITVS